MKKKNILYAALFALAAGTGNVSAQDGAAVNQLTSTEKKEGWQLLFDGKSTGSWHTYQHKPGSWIVEDSSIVCHETAAKQYADLVTNKQYKNFELVVDWKIAPGANSGILYKVTEQYPQSYLSGPEYQLLDNDSYAGKIEPYQKTGANYAMNTPSSDAAKPVGEWNHTRIVVKDNHVEHWLNDVKVVEYTLGDEAWQQEKAHGKWKDAPGYGAAAKGAIALQDYHGTGKVWFRNVKVREL
ncbi:3-keto-disaccharide hydrolase [Deminuibacter soli]|uniref:DUF1080 domain-containing protein n=1 Tax=Deminuibacter soli TaxID=2291815 RepID=A0A3E1NI04_9BACT|nr:DUF1080 domain-containing protein [Deminuibacter soli]RFM27575.1 DUF1080 domain-containing protein [Deminuibacter soli]